jgi:hypothetical protein
MSRLQHFVDDVLAQELLRQRDALHKGALRESAGFQAKSSRKDPTGGNSGTDSWLSCRYSKKESVARRMVCQRPTPDS